MHHEIIGYIVLGKDMMNVKVGSWNVNSLRVRLPHVKLLLEQYQFDFFAMQEIKIRKEQFPFEAFQAMGYHATVCGEQQYNGVAWLSRYPIEVTQTCLPNIETTQQRFVAITYHDLHLVNVYVPNGQDLASDKYQYKLQWLEQLIKYLSEAKKRYRYVMVVGDFNVAPSEIDIYDATSICQNSVLFNADLQRLFQCLLDEGWLDLYRVLHPTTKAYTWWDYRAVAFRRNHGWRLDHILINKALRSYCKACEIDVAPRGWIQPSDHTLIYADFDRGIID